MKNLKVATTELYARRYALGIGFFLILLIPGILIANFLIGGAASVFLFGALPVAVAFFGGTRKQSLLVLAFMTVAGTLARAFDGSPIPSALLVGLVALVIGLATRRGLASPILEVGIVLGFLVMSPPDLTSKDSSIFSGIDPVLATAILLAVGGFWALLVGAIVHKKAPTVPENKVADLSVVVPYALSLAFSTSVVTYFLLYFSAGHLGAWMILTIFVVMKPNQDSTMTKTKDRILGTFVGTAIAIIAIELLHLLNSQRGLVQITIAFLFIGIAMAYFVPGPYWVYVMCLTPGVVLLDSNAVSDQDNVALTRIAFTLIGITIALVIGFLVQRSSKVIAKRSSHYSGS
jgi:hypothetical protein|tara:strand:- start:574 stop:1614 length:1041 start_codon:yes stop_codon:yes gene_type:complete